jgi:peptidoglycan/xylan/chitin deacetylase (PgdA/CDA1 family)
MRRAIQWPDGKLVCCTFQVALEASKGSGSFKKDLKLAVNYNSLSHASYGGKIGAFKMVDVFKRHAIKATILVNGLAAEKWPDAVKALHAAGHEIAGHGYDNGVRQVDLDKDAQLKDIKDTTRILKDCVGERPVGWTGPANLFTEHTVGHLASEGYIWSGDQANDDVPYMVTVGNKKICIVPKLWYGNDRRAWADGLGNGASYFTGFKNAFDYVYQEALRGRPGRVDATIHAELGARPHLLAGFEKMMQYVNRYRNEVWIPTNREMAEWTAKTSKEALAYDPMG